MRMKRVLWGYDPRDVLKIQTLYQSERWMIEREAFKQAKQLKDERAALVARIRQLTAERDQLLAVERQITRHAGNR